MTTTTELDNLSAQYDGCAFIPTAGGGRIYTEGPTAPAQLPEAPALTGCAEQDGLAALLFVLRTNVTATLSDEAIALALHVSPRATAFTGTIAEPLLSAASLAHITAAIDELSAAQRRRAAAHKAAVATFQAQYGACDDQPNEGPMAPLAPPPSVPPAPPVADKPEPPPFEKIVADLAAKAGCTIDEARVLLAARIRRQSQAALSAGG